MDSIGSGSGSISSESRRRPQTGESVEKDILDDSRDDFDDERSSSKRRKRHGKGKENSIAIPRPISCPFCDRVLGGFLQGRRHVKFCGRKLKIDSTVVDEAVENLKESFAAGDDDLGAKKPKKTTKTKRYQPQRYRRRNRGVDFSPKTEREIDVDRYLIDLFEEWRKGDRYLDKGFLLFFLEEWMMRL